MSTRQSIIKKEKKIIKETAEVLGYADDLTEEKITEMAIENCDKKEKKKTVSKMHQEKDKKYIEKYGKVFVAESRNDFPDEKSKRQDYFMGSARLAAKCFPDKNSFAKQDIDAANALLDRIFSCRGMALLIYKNDLHKTTLRKAYPVKKIRPRRRSTVTLGETALNMSSVKGTSVTVCSASYSPKGYQVYNDQTVVESHCLNLCVYADGVHENENDTLSLFLDRFPFLERKEFLPDYIIDCGNDTFDIGYIFDDNIAEWRELLLVTTKLLSFMFEQDMKDSSISNEIHIPGTINSQGEKVQIIYDSGKERSVFLDFVKDIINFTQNSYFMNKKDGKLYSTQAADDFVKVKQPKGADHETDISGFFEFFLDEYVLGDNESADVLRIAKNKIDFITKKSSNEKSSFSRRKSTVPTISAEDIIDNMKEASEAIDKAKAIDKVPHSVSVDGSLMRAACNNGILHLIKRESDLNAWFARHRSTVDTDAVTIAFFELWMQTQILLGTNADKVLHTAMKMNRELGERAIDPQSITYYWKRYQDRRSAKVTKYVCYSDFLMKKMLNLSGDDLAYMKNRYTVREKREHASAVKRRKYEKYKQSDEYKIERIQKEEARIELIAAVMDEYERCGNFNEAAKKNGISCVTARKYRRMYFPTEKDKRWKKKKKELNKKSSKKDCSESNAEANFTCVRGSFVVSKSDKNALIDQNEATYANRVRKAVRAKIDKFILCKHASPDHEIYAAAKKREKKRFSEFFHLDIKMTRRSENSKTHFSQELSTNPPLLFGIGEL